MSDAWWVRPPTPARAEERANGGRASGLSILTDASEITTQPPIVRTTQTTQATGVEDLVETARPAEAGEPAGLVDLTGQPRLNPTTVLLTRRQAGQLRKLRRARQTRAAASPTVDAPRRTSTPQRARPSKTALALSGGGLVMVVAATLGGKALTDRPSTTVTTVAARAVPIDRSLITATATSTQKADGTTSYTAANTLDGDRATAWNSNGTHSRKKPPISLTYTFARPLDLRDIVLHNGYQKVRPRAGRTPLDLYRLNDRVHRLRVVTDAGTWVWDLADTRAAQTFTGAAGRTGSVRLEIVSVYPSTTYHDVAISEVGFTAALNR